MGDGRSWPPVTWDLLTADSVLSFHPPTPSHCARTRAHVPDGDTRLGRSGRSPKVPRRDNRGWRTLPASCPSPCSRAEPTLHGHVVSLQIPLLTGDPRRLLWLKVGTTKFQARF